MNETALAAPALGVSVQCAAGESTIVFQTHIPLEDANKAKLDSMVDMLTAVAARQKAKVELVEMRKNLKVNEDQLVRMREDRVRVERDLTAPAEGRRNQDRNAAELTKQRGQADANEKRFGEIIRDIKEAIAATEAVIAGT